jgi:hypothetical protein
VQRVADARGDPEGFAQVHPGVGHAAGHLVQVGHDP